jgi:prephenate dehydrogenase
VRWQKVTLVGVGLLGGSLGLALRQRKLAGSVAGYVRRAASVRECQQAGAVDLATRDLEEAAAGADLIVFCTPLGQMRPLVEKLLPVAQPGAVVTDVGSVKGSVVRELEPLVAQAGAHFIGSHPMAGAEKMGVAAARADLFAGAVCVVTPTRKSNAAALRKVEGLWRAVGGRLVRLTPKAHDKLVSRSSHLPYLIAAQLANLVLSSTSSKEQAMLCANGFRDTTRIASGSPEMWRDIVLANRENVLSALDEFANGLKNLQRRLKRGKPGEIIALMEQAKTRRDNWINSAKPAE